MTGTLQWRIPDSFDCFKAAEDGRMEALMWLKARGWHPTALTCIAAASGGRLRLLRWLKEIVPAFDAIGQLFFEAMRGNQSHVMEWLVHNGVAPILVPDIDTFVCITHDTASLADTLIAQRKV